MAFSATDLANIESAIGEIVTGKRVVATEVGGQRREFQRVDLVRLMELRDAAMADVNAAAGTGGILKKVSFRDAS